jgi:hypothetical protein
MAAKSLLKVDKGVTKWIPLGNFLYRKHTKLTCPTVPLVIAREAV